MMAFLYRLVFAALVAALAWAARAPGQCQDWSRLFGPTSHGLNGRASTFKVFDDGTGPALYVGGSFTTAGGAPIKGVAKWTGTEWAGLGDGVGGVTALEVFDDGTGPALYAGGPFFASGGAAGDHIAKWNGVFWEPLSSGVSGNVQAMAVYDDGTGPALYAAGFFNSADGQPTEGIASWNGTEWRTWDGGPRTRTRFAMAYDAARQRVVLFGGVLDGVPQGDTWTWDGTAWTQASTSGPGPRIDAVMAYDSVHSRILMVGGSTSVSTGLDMSTWAWDGVQWTLVAGPSGLSARRNFAMVHDSGRDRLVLFGGRVSASSSTYLDETWEFDGTSWTQPLIGLRPRRRILHGMVYDAARAKTVLFGGSVTTGTANETWEYNGSTWTQVSTTGPSTRHSHGMTYDSARGRTIMQGGRLPDTSYATDTWAWDGSSWTLVDAGDAAWAPRYGPMVYDAARDRVMQRTEQGMTWLFNGSSWAIARAGAFNAGVAALVVHDDGSGPALYACGEFTLVAGAPGRVARWRGASTWEVVEADWGVVPTELRALASADLGAGPRLFMGGSIRWSDSSDAGIVQWDGAEWSPLSPDTRSSVHAMCVHDDGTGPALYAAGSIGWQDHGVLGFARWDGTAWAAFGYEAPPARRDSASAYDPVRREIVLYGGAANLGSPAGASDDTWVWNGRTWIPVATPGPGPRYGHAMAFDSVNSRVILVGGGATSTSNDAQTWSWNGTAWSLLSTSFGDGSRTLHAMAYDSARGRLVLFGGQDNSGAVLPGTWEFDGANWTLVTMAGPAARHSHAMAYDPVRQRTVLYAGVDGGGNYHNDIWEWDGAAWTNPSPDSGPGLRRPAMTYDSFRQRILAGGGVNQTSDGFGGLREWDGTSWGGSLGLPSGARYAQLMTFDETLNALVVFGGVQPIFPPGTLRVAGDTNLRISGLPSDEWVDVIEGVDTPRSIAVFDDGSGLGVFVGGDFSRAGPSTPSSRIAKWGVPCEPPVITDQPDSVTATYDQNVFFNASAFGTGRLAYQWYHNGQPLTDIPGRIIGARISGLRIYNGWSVADTGSYELVVRSSAGDTISQIATLNVVCPADLTGDSLVDFSDYLEFLNLFDAQDPRVDFNQDGLIDFSDYLEFLNLFEIGC